MTATKHPHAELMLQYAQDAMTTDKPWELWELCKSFDPYLSEWRNLSTHPRWIEGNKYRRKQPADPWAELRKAAADPTKQIRFKGGAWMDYSLELAVQTNSPLYDPSDYEIRDKPKAMKRIKLLAWFSGYDLMWRAENTHVDCRWKRVPSEDRIIEVEE